MAVHDHRRGGQGGPHPGGLPDEAFADGDERPFAVMQATMTAVYDRPGISG